MLEYFYVFDRCLDFCMVNVWLWSIYIYILCIYIWLLKIRKGRGPSRLILYNSPPLYLSLVFDADLKYIAYLPACLKFIYYSIVDMYSILLLYLYVYVLYYSWERYFKCCGWLKWNYVLLWWGGGIPLNIGVDGGGIWWKFIIYII